MCETVSFAQEAGSKFFFLFLVLNSLQRELIGFSLDLTIGDALDVMGHYEIFEVAVLNASSNCVGFVDYLDLLVALVRLTGEADESAVEPIALTVRPADYDHLTRRANDWTLEQAVVVLSASRPFFCASLKSTTVEEALRFMGAGVHHLLVQGEEGAAVANQVSQTDMIRELSKHVEELGPVAKLTLKEAGLGERAVLCVRNTDAALDAFVELQQAGVSGGAIVNGEGKLVGNLSRHDLKGVQGGTGFGALNQSIMHYQRKHRVALAQRLVTVTPASTLAEILSTMAREKVFFFFFFLLFVFFPRLSPFSQVHRVFVVEGGMLPRGLVTQTDICRVLSERLSGAKFGKKKQQKAMAKHCKKVLQFPLIFPPNKE